MLEVNLLVVRFADAEFQYQLHTAPKETVAIVGPSGSGKSTLLNAIAGFITPKSGQVCWEGKKLNALTADKRPVTSLFQDGNLFEHLTVAQNVALGIKPSLKTSSDEHKQVQAVLSKVGLRGFEQRRPSACSGGERQRVALARCLLRNKPLLLLDEPYSALDSTTRQSMLQLTRDIATELGLTLILVTHDPSDARALSARVVDIRGVCKLTNEIHKLN